MRHCLATIKVACGDSLAVYNALLEACHKTGLTVVGVNRHDFWPHGLTAVVILAESHFAVHTYPEEGLIFADCFTCGDIEPHKPIHELARQLGGVVDGQVTVPRCSRSLKAPQPPSGA